MDSNYTCLAVISLDLDLKKDENYYPLSASVFKRLRKK